MRTKLAAAALTAALLPLSACSSDDDKATAPTATPSVDMASINAAAGLPPKPDATTAAAYISDLNAIDPRIVKPGKNDQAVSRGINQCGSIKTTKDRAKLIELTLDRFTITTRLPEISNPDTGGKVLDVVHKRLCPTF